MSVERQERAIRTAYFVRIPNVGDRINPTVVTAITGRAVSRYAGQDEPHLLAIGSVMASATALSQVWGTGVMHPDLGIGTVPASNVHALRGPFSHSVMRKGGVPVGDVPFGDPGYLAPSLLGIKRAATLKFRVGLVCHYVDRLNPVFRRMMKESGVTDLNVHELPEVFLARMAECETILSSSLHGLIFAEALNIPNLWIKAGDDIAGGDFKFRDWFSTTRRPQVSHHLLTGSDTAEELAKKAECHESTIDVAALTAAFPHHGLVEMELPVGRRIMSAADCRRRPIPVFLISFNRGGMLKRTIAAIRRLSTPTEIVIHDNGSTDPATTAILSELEKSGIKVFRYPAINSDAELNRVDETVQSVFSEWGEPSRYVVSDCDVDMSVADPRVLDVYDQTLRAAGASDVARWKQTAYHYANWAERGVALARLIRPGESVFEFGAGRSAVPNQLPPGCCYTASDVAPLTPGIISYDLNAPVLSQIPDHDVALFSGVLEYVHDLSRAAHFLAGNFASVVCSYAALVDGSSEEIERRRYSGWFTDLTDTGFIALFGAAGFALTSRANWETQILFRFDKRPAL